MLDLFRGWRHVPLADRCFLFGSRARRCSAGTAVIADAIYRGRVVDYGCAVNVVNVGDVHIVDGLVVVELPSSPIAAIVTATRIPVAIGNATVEADDRTPVAGMPVVQPVVKRPVTGRPKQAGFGGQRPRAGYPVVSNRTPRPVAWHPNIAFGRAKGLLVNRKCRRTEVDRHEDLRKRSARYGQHHQCEQQRTNRAHDMHLTPLLPDHPSLGRRLLCLPHRLRRLLAGPERSGPSLNLPLHTMGRIMSLGAGLPPHNLLILRGFWTQTKHSGLSCRRFRMERRR